MPLPSFQTSQELLRLWSFRGEQVSCYVATSGSLQLARLLMEGDTEMIPCTCVDSGTAHKPHRGEWSRCERARRLWIFQPFEPGMLQTFQDVGSMPE